MRCSTTTTFNQAEDLLSNQEEVRRRLSQIYQFIMVDEYQDTNALQAQIIRLLAATHNNVAVVGDDAQSIYSFRGANFRNIGFSRGVSGNPHYQTRRKLPQHAADSEFDQQNHPARQGALRQATLHPQARG